MQTALRKMGNSTGMILPKEILRQIGAGVGAAMELSVDGNRVIATPVERAGRTGWEAAAAEIAAADDQEAEAWKGLANKGDAELEW